MQPVQPSPSCTSPNSGIAASRESSAPATIDTTRRRRAGFLAAARRLKVKPVIVEATGLGADAGRSAAAAIFAEHPDITAIFASTFAQGMGVLRAARETRKSVPQEMSVIALHDSELADYLDPPLTTIRLPVDEMARRAVDLLVGMIEGGRPQSVIVETAPWLVLRQSTGKHA